MKAAGGKPEVFGHFGHGNEGGFFAFDQGNGFGGVFGQEVFAK